MKGNGKYTVEEVLGARAEAVQKTNADLQDLDKQIKAVTKKLHEANERIFELEVDSIMGKGNVTQRAIGEARLLAKQLEEERLPLQERYDRNQEIRREVLERVDAEISPQFKILMDPLTRDLGKKAKSIGQKFADLHKDFEELASLQEARHDLYNASRKIKNGTGQFERDPELEKILGVHENPHLTFSRYVSNFANAISNPSAHGLYGIRVPELVHPKGFQPKPRAVRKPKKDKPVNVPDDVISGRTLF